MSDIITPATALAVVTFLWYRKGRLWNFYDSLLLESQEQIKKNSIDRERWKQIALKQCNELSKELFNSLFRFEIDYLRNKILSNQYRLWIGDSSEDSDVQITYTDKEKFCRHKLKQIFFSDFRFCGFRLLIKAIKYKVSERNDKDPGYVETKKNK